MQVAGECAGSGGTLGPEKVEAALHNDTGLRALSGEVVHDAVILEAVGSPLVTTHPRADLLFAGSVAVSSSLTRLARLQVCHQSGFGFAVVCITRA